MSSKINLRKLLDTLSKPKENEVSQISEFQYLEGAERLFKVLDRTREEQETLRKNLNNEIYKRGIIQKLEDSQIVLHINEE